MADAVQPAAAPAPEDALIEPAPAPQGPKRRVAPKDIPKGYVKIRVLKKGHRKIFTGETALARRAEFLDPESDDNHWQPTFSRDDEAVVLKAAAIHYEDEGMAEIIS